MLISPSLSLPNIFIELRISFTKKKYNNFMKNYFDQGHSMSINHQENKNFLEKLIFCVFRALQIYFGNKIKHELKVDILLISTQ